MVVASTYTQESKPSPLSPPPALADVWSVASLGVLKHGSGPLQNAF